MLPSILRPITRLCWRGSACPSTQHFATSTDSDITNQQLQACLSDTRGVVRLAGKHTLQFLQGMVTSDMRPLETAGASPVYAAILTPKGKFLHDVMFYQQPDGSVLMDVDSQGKEDAIDWLTRYKLRKDVTITDVSNQYSVWVQFGGASQRQVQPMTGWWADPRLAALGSRAILPASDQPASQHSSIISSSLGVQQQAATAAERYKQWRYQHGVAEGEVEIPTGKAAPLDYNLDVLNGVSYKKGCYIGQERNSFTHYRGVIRKRCMPCTVQQGDQMQLRAGESIIVDGTGEIAGSIQGVSAGHGLTYIKLKAAFQAIEGKLQLRAQGSQALIQPFRPYWWDPQWGFEELGSPDSDPTAQ